MGLSGIGQVDHPCGWEFAEESKTLATKFAQHIQHQHNIPSLIFVRGSSDQNLAESLQDVVERLGLEFKSTGGYRQLMITLTKWLSDGSEAWLCNLHLQKERCCILRGQESKKAIGVEELSRENCLELLHDHPGNICDEESVEGLVKNLGGVPSILLQAANKIHEFGSAKRYLAFYTANDDNRGRLPQQRRGISQYLSSSTIPWEEDFQALFEEDFHAIALLKSLMYLNSDSISKPLVHELKSGVESTKWPLEEDLDFAQHVALLENYFFVRSRVEQNDLFLDCAVQTCFRIWVTDTSVHEFIHGQAVRMLHSKFKPAELSEWPICRMMLPHIETVAIRRPQLREYLQDWCYLLISGAWFSTMILDLPENTSWTESIETLESNCEATTFVELVLRLAEVKGKAWKQEAVCSLSKRARKCAKAYLDPESPTFVSCEINYIFYRLLSNGRTSKSLLDRLIVRYSKILETGNFQSKRKVLEYGYKLLCAMKMHDRPEEGLVLGTGMLRSMELMNILIIHPLWNPIWRGISSLELKKRNYDVAHDYCELARKNAVEIFGSHHPSTLSLTHGLGRIALARSEHQAAERYYREVIQTASHHVKYDSMVDLGYIFELREELEQAENMYQRGLNGYRKFLGSRNWVTCRAEKNLSNVQRKRAGMHANVTTNNTTTRTSPSKELS